MKHEPCRLLCDSEGAMKFMAADAVLGIRNEPNGREPYGEFKRAILKNCADLDAKLFLTALAVPNEPGLDQFTDVSRAATRADDFPAPPPADHVIMADFRVGEKQNGLLERLGYFKFVRHTLIIPDDAG